LILLFKVFEKTDEALAASTNFGIFTFLPKRLSGTRGHDLKSSKRTGVVSYFPLETSGKRRTTLETGGKDYFVPLLQVEGSHFEVLRHLAKRGEIKLIELKTTLETSGKDQTFFN
jgi:hypothetical protein